MRRRARETANETKGHPWKNLDEGEEPHVERGRAQRVGDRNRDTAEQQPASRARCASSLKGPREENRPRREEDDQPHGTGLDQDRQEGVMTRAAAAEDLILAARAEKRRRVLHLIE